MSEEAKPRKSGRTAEQEVARAARKAAKKAAAEAEAAKAKAAEGGNAEEDKKMEVDAAETKATETETAETTEKPSRKRPAQDDDADLLEINLSAETPMSKAELRAAKKRAKRGEPPLPPKKSAGEDEKEDAASGDEEKPARWGRVKEEKPKPQPKGEFSIWVGNLSFRTTPESLQEFLVKGVVDSGGEEDCITRVHMPKKADKGSFAQNKGFAYVDFKTDALRLLAIGLSERPLEGRRLLIKAGDDHKANPDARTPKQLPSGPGTVGPQVLAKQKHGESSTLFIGNLPFDVTEEELRDLVESNAGDGIVVPGEQKEDDGEDEDEGEGEGEEEEEGQKKAPARGGVKSGLIKTRLAQFEDTGRCKGFAFWDFKSPAHAKAALLNRRNHTLRGRRLNLQFASEEATKRSGAAKKKAREAEEREGTRPRRDGGRPAKRPRYFDGGEGEGEDGGYEARSSYNASGPTDYKSEKDAAARIAAMVSGEGDAQAKPERRERSGPKPKWEQAGRPRPGAALAMAKREKVGIVASEGNKITFD